MYSMWEVHLLVAERQAGLERDARRQSLRRLLRETQKRDRAGQTAGDLRQWLTVVLGHWPLRRPEAARR
jgi:hypothetical protein